jgi:acetyl-CoA acetyltransferase family protein
MLGREVVIAEAVRTPVGRGHAEKGWFKDEHPAALLGATFSAVIERAGIPGEAVDDVVAGCVSQYGVQSYNVARNAWLHEGLPVETPGTTVDRQCGSAQQAINFAAALVGTGAHDVVIGGGVEHMGRVPMSAAGAIMADYGHPFTPELLERHPVVHQGLSAELIAERWEVSRRECDEIALRSQERAARATDEGRFEREILPIGGNGTPYASDQGIRPTTLDALAGLKPAFKPDGRLTAGNSSQVSDGAAAVLLMARETADERGVRPRARIVDHLTVGVDPVLMLTGPIPATRRILERNGMTIADVDLIEINEAFASVIAAWERELDPDIDKVNVNGGAIALGHPLGATGARLMTTLLHELERSDGQFGLVTMCCGGGLGTATLIERI